MKNQYEIKQHLTDDELEIETKKLGKQYVGQKYQHQNGEIYTIIDITIININGTAYWAFVYDKLSLTRTSFTCPMHEFLDGRFTLIE